MLKTISTTVHANGSKFAGEAPNTLEHLIYLLTCGLYLLDPVFEEHGHDFITVSELNRELGLEHTCFLGNFKNISNVFHVSSNDPEIIEVLSLAIRTNQALPEYKQWKVRRAELLEEFEKQTSVQEVPDGYRQHDAC